MRVGEATRIFQLLSRRHPMRELQIRFDRHVLRRVAHWNSVRDETGRDGTIRTTSRPVRRGLHQRCPYAAKTRRNAVPAQHSTTNALRSLARSPSYGFGGEVGGRKRELRSRTEEARVSVPSSGWWRQHKGGDQWVGGLEPAASPVGVSQVVRCAAKTRLSGGKYRRRDETRRDETGRDSGGCLRYAIHMEVADFTATLRTPAAKRL